ncbi:divergent PAP2 family protein [Thermodesulfitimonas sp.]
MFSDFAKEWLANHKLITAPLTACGVAQFVKGVYMYLKERCWRWSWLISDGGTPSAQSAMVTAMVAAIGFSLGYDSEEFALALVFALIVLHDAMGVRRLAGKHSRLLKTLLREKDNPTSPVDLPEHPVGHTPYEVLAGALIGILVASIVFDRGPVWREAFCHIRHLTFRHHVS